MSSSLGYLKRNPLPAVASRPVVLPSIECDYCAPVWEDGIRPDLARHVLLVHEPADNTFASAAILNKPKTRRSGKVKKLDPRGIALLKSKSQACGGTDKPFIPPEIETEVDKLVKDYAHLRYYAPRQRELAFEFEVLIDGASAGRIKAVARRWTGGSGVRYPVHILEWLEILRRNMAQKVMRQIC